MELFQEWRECWEEYWDKRESVLEELIPMTLSLGSLIGGCEYFLKIMFVQIGIENVCFERSSEVSDHRVAPHPH